MNYYEHHIGDYAEATAHLSFVEDAAYSRLIRKYYAQEKPLPGDIKSVQRLVGARTKEEKNAVTNVLEEFFFLTSDGWRNSRCDAEIEEFLAGEPERAIKKANENNRLKRHREERALLFMRVTEAGHHLPWNVSIVELREFVKRLDETLDTLLPPLPATAPATPATATQTPDTNTQTPVISTNTASANLSSIGEKKDNGARASPGEISKAMRSRGVMSQPADPRIIAISEQGVSVETVISACDEAKRAKPNTQSIGPGYVIAIIERWAQEAKEINAQGAKSALQREQERVKADADKAVQKTQEQLAEYSRTVTTPTLEQRAAALEAAGSKKARDPP